MLSLTCWFPKTDTLRIWQSHRDRLSLGFWWDAPRTYWSRRDLPGTLKSIKRAPPEGSYERMPSTISPTVVMTYPGP